MKFRNLFLISAWIIFIASEKNVWSSVFLLLVGLYTFIEVLLEIKDDKKAKRKLK